MPAWNIEFVTATGAVFDGPKLAGRGVDRGSLRVAVAVAPDLRLDARASRGERIVARDGAIAIEANNLAEMLLQVLRLLTIAAVAERDEQFAIGGEYNPRPKCRPLAYAGRWRKMMVMSVKRALPPAPRSFRRAILVPVLLPLPRRSVKEM